MKKLVLAFLILLLLSSCSAPKVLTTPEPLNTSTTAPTLTPSATLTPTATFTPLPTNTPTITPTPTKTPFPTATPEPEGFYSSERGFSFVLPKNWTVVKDEDPFAVFDSPGGMLRLVWGSFDLAGDIAPTMVEMVESLCPQFVKSYSDYVIDQDEEIILADSSSAERVLFTCNSNSGDAYQMQMILTTRGEKLFEFLAVSSTAQFNASQLKIVDDIQKTISLTSADVFGLPRGETLLLLGYDPEPEDLDPAVVEGGADGFVGLLYAGLVRLTPDMQIVGDLAESWDVSEDGLVYTFKLRPGLKFEDGSPLTAEDVRYSWERAADPKTDSPTASTYLGDIKGFQDKLDGKAEEVSGIKVIDDLTLEVTLESPVQYFLAKLIYPSSFVVQKAAVEADPEEWMYSPNASGPYKLVERVEWEYITFERNDNYYDPALVRYIAYKTDAPGTDLSYYQSGDADVVYPSLVDYQELQAEDHPLHNMLLTGPSMNTGFIMFNNTMPPMDDPNVRLALTLAIDKDKMIEQFFDNVLPRADGILPPGMPGYTGLTAQEFDPQAARDALAASSYADNMPTLILTDSGYAGDENAWADALIQMWRENLGIQVKIEYIDPIDFHNVISEKHGHMVLYGWSADYPDPSNFLDVLFYTDSGFNVSGYTNPEVDALLLQARTEPDPATRLDLYRQVEVKLMEDHAALPIYNSISIDLVNPRVHGYAPTNFGINILHDIYIAAPED